MPTTTTAPIDYKYRYEYNSVYLIIFRGEIDVNFLQDEDAHDLYSQLQNATYAETQVLLEPYDVEECYRYPVQA